ncbi:MAG TPA: serine protease [Vicinamibacterales bacterium]|nr:serine protease [Vicinamibacterales bacterium]
MKVVLVDAEQKATPVPRHALLISDNPSSAPPRRVVTGLDGTADVKLRPGNYTVESERPVTFFGKSYQWTQTLDVAAGKDPVLELTAKNAEVETVTGSPAGAPALEADPAFLLPQWQDAVVALWTPTTRASGFIIDASGLVVTNQRIIGAATSVEVQITPAVKVAGSILAADAEHDVAVLRIDPAAVASIRPLPLACGQTAKPSVANGQEIFTIGVPTRQRKGMTSGTVTRVDGGGILSDFILARGSIGGPVFTARGELIGITSNIDDPENSPRETSASRIVRSDDACVVVASAQKQTQNSAPPRGTHLPIEPERPFPVDALQEAAKKRAGGLSPYQISSSTFDIGFITPVLTYSAQYQTDQANRRARDKAARTPGTAPELMRPLMDFGSWTDYVAEFPPVLMVRVTPKLSEGFWTMIARGAARTQGVSIPPIKRFKSGFSRLRAFCGDAEVTPIHPFKLERRVSDTDSIYEGLYVFDPGALGPQCGAVKLMLYSEKEPERGDTRVVDAKVIEQIWQDFAPYRGAS